MEPRGDVLELRLAQGDQRAQIEFLGYLLIDFLGDTDRVGFSQTLEPGGDVDAIAKYISLLLENITQMNADTDVNLFALLVRGVVCSQLGMNRLGALHGMDDRGELDQEGITNSFDNMAMMVTHSLLDEAVMDVKQPHRAGFVRTHLMAEADDISEHDRREPSSLGWSLLCQTLFHGGDYS